MSKRSLIMKQYSKKLFSLVVLCSTATIALADCCDNDDNGNQVVPFIQWRSQGRNMARKLEGTTSFAVYQNDMDNKYGTFNMTVEYDQSFRGKNIAECLFGNSLVTAPAAPRINSCDNDCDDSCNSTLIVSGSANANRAATDWMAENFLLPRDFKSAISFSPKVQSVIVDFNLFVGLDRWVNGLYFRLYGPVVWNKSGLRANETIINQGTAAGSYSQGYFDDETAVANTSLFQSALNFFGGCQLPKYLNQDVVVQPLNFAKFSDCNLNANNNNNNCDNDCNGTSHHKTGFAELRGEFGWNYIQEKYRLMLNIQAAAPTGTRPNAEFLLPAYVGNGKHWELGGGFGGSWKMWGSEDGEKSFNFIVEADITHLFKAKQKMTFDLKGKPNSRYMLAEQLVTPPANLQLVPNTPTFAIDGKGLYMPVANFSTRDVKVGFGVQGDVVAMFNYTHRNFSWDIGYNFWGMSCSEVSLSCDDNCNDSDDCNPIIIPFPINMALKGDASIAGYTADGAVAFGLGATDSKATIFKGTNVGATAFTSGLNNPAIDNPQLAVGVPVPPSIANTDLFIAGGTVADPETVRINTSVPPIFISIDDLDVEGAEQRGLSNKVFTHFNYTWTDRDKWVPYVGVGFSAEFGKHSGNDNCSTTPVTTSSNDCSSCHSCALSQWGVEVKGGVSFH